MDVNISSVGEEYFQALYQQNRISLENAESALALIKEAYQYETCTICLELGKENMVKMFNCDHLLHRVCATKLFQTTNIAKCCPYCRSDMLSATTHPNELTEQELPEPPPNLFYESAPTPIRDLIDHLNLYINSEQESSDSQINLRLVNRISLAELYLNLAIPTLQRRVASLQAPTLRREQAITHLEQKLSYIEAVLHNIEERLQNSEVRLMHLEDVVSAQTTFSALLLSLRRGISSFQRNYPSLFKQVYMVSFTASLLLQHNATRFIQSLLLKIDSVNEAACSRAIWLTVILVSFPLTRLFLGDSHAISLAVLPAALLMTLPTEHPSPTTPFEP